MQAGSTVSPGDVRTIQKKARPLRQRRANSTCIVPSTNVTEPGMPVQESIAFKEKDFVLCRYETETDRRQRRFIGRVTDIEGDNVEVDSLRYKRGYQQDFFVYPEIPDVVNVRAEDIELKLDAMTERRGRYYSRNFDSRKYAL